MLLVASPSSTSRPRVLFLAAAIISIEALSAAAYALVAATTIRSSRLVVGAGVTLLMLGYAALLAAVARGVARGRRWSRGPAVATQLLQALLASSFASGVTWKAGLALGVVALAALVCLLVPSATAVFTREPPIPEES